MVLIWVVVALPVVLAWAVGAGVASLTWALSFSLAAICPLALTVVLTWVVELAVVLLGCRTLGPKRHLKVLTQSKTSQQFNSKKTCQWCLRRVICPLVRVALAVVLIWVVSSAVALQSLLQDHMMLKHV